MVIPVILCNQNENSSNINIKYALSIAQKSIQQVTEKLRVEQIFLNTERSVPENYWEPKLKCKKVLFRERKNQKQQKLICV